MRGLDPIEELGEEGIEYAPSEDGGDLSQQLGEKIRSQAHRLAALEQYRLLCEQRLLEFDPDHPLPVLPEHLGNDASASDRTELHQALQRIARLEQELAQSQVKVPLSEFHSFPAPSTQLSHGQLQELYSALYFKAQSLMREKADLEEGLRTETLQTEEQRAYIEALKQALEAKMEQWGVRPGSIDLFTELSQTKSQLDRLKHEKVKSSGALSEQQDSLQDVQRQLALRTKEAADSQGKSRALSKELQEVTRALQQSVDELSKLEEEKAALLDYVKEHAELEKALTEAQTALSTDLKAEKDEHSLTLQRLKQAERDLTELQSATSQLAQSSSLEVELDRVTGRLQAADTRVKLLEGQLQSATEQAKSAAQRNEKLQANYATLSDSMHETQEELDQIRALYNSLLEDSKNKQEITPKITQLLEKVRNLEATEQLSQERIAGYESLIEELNHDHETKLHLLHTKQDQTVQESQSLRQQVRALDEELRALREDCEAQVSAVKGERERMQGEWKRAVREREEMEGKVQEVQESQSKSVQSEVKRLSHSLAAAQRRAAELEEDSAALRSQLAEAEAETHSLSTQIRERDKRLSEALSSNEALKTNLDSLQADLDKISADTQAITEEASRARQLEQRANQSLLQHSAELQTLRKAVSQSANVVAVFAGNFGAVSAATAAYGTVISEAFREMIGKWGDWVEGDVVSTAAGLIDWVKVATEESEALIRRVVELKEALEETNSQQTLYEGRLRDLDSADRLMRNRENDLARELDGLIEINQALKRENELAYQRMESLTADNVKSRREVQTLSDELSRVKDQMSLCATDTMKGRGTGDEEAVKGLEERVGVLGKEKKELELLLARLQSAVPSNPIQRVFLDMMKARSDLEIGERERMRLESLLLTKEAEMRVQTRTGDRQQAAEIRKEVESLRIQLANSETQIGLLRRQMAQFEAELQEAERVEKRRFALQEENEQSVALLQEQLFLKTKELAHTKAARDPSPEELPALQSMESRLSRLSVRENRPRLTLQDKLSQAKAELSQLRRRPPA